MTDQHRSRVPDTRTTTEHPGPTEQPAPGGQAPSPEPVAGCVYEAGFSTTGPHPQGGVAIARTVHDARRRLADMLIFCDPAAAVTADITAFTAHQVVARYRGTVAHLVADLTSGAPDRTVHAQPLVGLTTPPSTGRR